MAPSHQPRLGEVGQECWGAPGESSLGGIELGTPFSASTKTGDPESCLLHDKSPALISWAGAEK